MIITHTHDLVTDQHRVYLGGKSSLDFYIEPDADGIRWRVGVEPSVTGLPMEPDDQAAVVKHQLLRLARDLNVAPHDLAAVPYEVIAALHACNPFENRRMAAPRNRCQQAYMATPPGITRPSGDFRSSTYPHDRQRPR
ncbi:MAG: hypothetical protein P9E88_05370 [Candidatus Competibacter sp.]|nr:hypothetical protein [Candidatus Competibacter sp.]